MCVQEVHPSINTARTFPELTKGIHVDNPIMTQAKLWQSFSLNDARTISSQKGIVIKLGTHFFIWHRSNVWSKTSWRCAGWS